MKPSRKAVLATTCAAFGTVGIPRYPAGAAEFSFKLSNDVATDHPMHLYFTDAAAQITQQSGGRLEIHTFPNSTLGGQTQTLEQLRLGALEFMLGYDAVTETIVRAAGLTGIPFAFPSYKAIADATDGSLGKYVRDALAKVGINSGRSWNLGFRQVENSLRPVHTPADMKGLKLRAANSPVESSLMATLGVTPVALNGAEEYVSIQTHLVDGAATPLLSVKTRKLYELVKYVSRTNHMGTDYTFLASNIAWQKLPNNLRDLCEKNFDTAALRCRAEFATMEGSLETFIKGHGCTFNDTDSASFKTAIRAAGLYKQWRDHYGAAVWAQLEQAVGPLA